MQNILFTNGKLNIIQLLSNKGWDRRPQPKKVRRTILRRTDLCAENSRNSSGTEEKIASLPIFFKPLKSTLNFNSITRFGNTVIPVLSKTDENTLDYKSISRFDNTVIRVLSKTDESTLGYKSISRFDNTVIRVLSKTDENTLGYKSISKFDNTVIQ